MTRTATAGWCRRSAGLRPDEGGFDAPDVAILVAEDGLVDVAEALKLVGQHSGLVTAELEHERAPVPEKAPGVAENASQDVGAVGAAVVGERRFEREGVPLEQWQLGGRHVGDDADDDVDAAYEFSGQRREEVVAIHLHADRGGARDRTLVDVGGYDTGARAMHGEDAGDRAGSGAEVNGCPIRWQAVDRALHERLGEPARHVDAGIDAYGEAAERGLPGDPGEWLAGEPASDRRIEEFIVAGGVGKQFLRLLLRRDEAFAAEQCTERRVIVRYHHGVNVRPVLGISR